VNAKHWTALTLLLLGLLGLFLFASSNREQEMIEIDGPRIGEAAYNPLYALKLALLDMDKQVDAFGALRTKSYQAQVSGKPSVLVLDVDIAEINPRDSGDLLNFVSAGGRLLIPLPDPELDGEVALLDGIGWVESQRGCLQWSKEKLGEAELENGEFCGERSIGLYDLEEYGEPDPLWQAPHRPDRHVLVRISYGEGQIYFASNLKMLHSNSMRYPNQQALASFMLSPWLDSKQFYLVYGGRSLPWYVWLFRATWTILLPLFIALLAWIYLRNQRLGPVLPEIKRDRNSLLDHLDANGEFLARRKRRVQLCQDLLKRELQKVRRLDPMLMHFKDGDLLEHLRTIHAIAASEYNTILSSPAQLEQEEKFIASVKLIHQLPLRVSAFLQHTQKKHEH
jgi:hypothetical protein